MGAAFLVAEAMAELYSADEISAAREAALKAAIERRQTVTITSAKRRGDGTTGAITGSPDEILGFCKLAAQIQAGTASATPPIVAFSQRYAST